MQAPFEMEILVLIIPEAIRNSASTRPKAVFPVEGAQAVALLENAGHQVSVCDFNLVPADERVRSFKGFLVERKPAVAVAVPQFLTFNITESLSIIKTAFAAVRKRNRDAITILCGSTATSSPQAAFSRVQPDFIIRGEYETRLWRLVEAMDGGAGILDIEGIWRPESNGGIFWEKRLSDLPFPAYQTIQYETYFNHPEYGNIRFPEKSRRFSAYQATRGCPCKCSFCNVAYLRGTRLQRRRPIDQIIEHLSRLNHDYGIEEIHFIDENLTLHRKFALELFRRMVEKVPDIWWMPAAGVGVYTLSEKMLELMRRSGCYRLPLAFESGSQDVLSKQLKKPVNLDKGLRLLETAKKMGFETIGYFIIGLPGERPEEQMATIKLAENDHFDYVVFSIATPQKGTRLEAECRRDGFLNPQADIDRLPRRSQAALDMQTITKHQLERLRVSEWDRINFRSEERIATICRMMGIDQAALDAMRASTWRNLEQRHSEQER